MAKTLLFSVLRPVSEPFICLEQHGKLLDKETYINLHSYQIDQVTAHGETNQYFYL